MMSDSKPRTAVLRAGASQVDITPKMGTHLAGYIGQYRPAELLVEPLYAKALVLELNGRKLCFVSLDLTGVTRKYGDEIRHLAADKFGFDAQAVMVHPVQNHASPPLGHFMLSDECESVPPDLWWLRGGDDRYHPYAVERIIEAIGKASESLQPVKVGIAGGLENRVAFNRRFVMRDGTGRSHPKRHELSEILYTEGPIDPELGVMCFTTESLHIAAMLLHHTCHPVHGCGGRYVTSGWPGAWADGMRKALGKDCVPLIVNGCCGNVHHANHLDTSYVDDYQRMGRLLTEKTEEILKGVSYQDVDVLDWKVKHVGIPIRELDSREIERAESLLKEHPDPIWRKDMANAIEWDWVYAVTLLDLQKLRQRRPQFDYEIQVLRVGDTALVGLPGEPFVEGQLRIKLESPAKRTYIAHMCNSFAGYIPTKEALARGGYETRTAHWSKLAPDALDTIVNESVSLLKEVFPEKRSR